MFTKQRVNPLAKVQAGHSREQIPHTANSHFNKSLDDNVVGGSGGDSTHDFLKHRARVSGMSVGAAHAALVARHGSDLVGSGFFGTVWDRIKGAVLHPENAIGSVSDALDSVDRLGDKVGDLVQKWGPVVGRVAEKAASLGAKAAPLLADIPV